MKKIVSIVLLVAMLLVMIPAGVVSAESVTPATTSILQIPAGSTSFSDNGVEYTVIWTLEQLKAATAKGNYILGADIDGANAAVADTLLTFAAGTLLNGNGHCIKGFALTEGKPMFALAAASEQIKICNLSIGTPSEPITVTASAQLGLFANDNAANVVVWENDRFYVNATLSNGANYGMLIPQMFGKHTLTGCEMHATINHSSNWSEGMWIGQQQNTSVLTMTDCASYGSLTTKGQAGGIIGNLQGSVNITNFSNYATLTGNNVGGVAGYLVGNAGMTHRLNHCVNYGALNGSVAGGIYGDVTSYNDTTSIIFENCINHGVITATGNCGGLIGHAQKIEKMTGCTNYGFVRGETANSGGMIGRIEKGTTFENCANYGAVSNGTAGGFIGCPVSQELNLTGCLNAGEVTGTSHTGGFFGWCDAAPKMTDCANIGVVGASVAGKKLGNIGGYVKAGGLTLTNVYCFGAVSATDMANAGAILGSGSGEPTAATNVQYVAVENAANTLGTSGATVVTAEQTLALLNAMFTGKTFVLNKGMPVDQTTLNPVLRGVQSTDVVDGKYRVRFIAGLNSLDYDYIGFTYSYTYTDAEGKVKTVTDKQYCQYVMTSILAEDEGGTATQVTADQLCAQYLFALTINAIPTSVGEVVFTVTPFAQVGKDEADSNTTVYTGNAVTVTYNAGAFVGYVNAD